MRPSFANALFVAVPLLMATTSFIVAEMAGRELAKLRETWSEADSRLEVAAKDGWTAAGLIAIRVALTQMKANHFTLAKRLRMTAALYVFLVSLDSILYIPLSAAIVRLRNKQFHLVRQSLANSAHLNALTASAPVQTILLPFPPSIAAPPLKSPSLRCSGSTSSTKSSLSRLSTTPLPPTTLERNWHPGYEEELVAKVRKLERARRSFLINAVSTICASLAFLAYAIRLLVTRFVGEITSLDLHRYRVALLWWPAISFLIFCTPPTLLFLHISFTTSGVISASTQTHPPPPLSTPGYDDYFAPASARPSVDSERSVDRKGKRNVGSPERMKEATESVAARYSASERGRRIQFREVSESSESASREGTGSGSGSGSGGMASGRGAAEGREGMWELRLSQWAEARVKEREGC